MARLRRCLWGDSCAAAAVFLSMFASFGDSFNVLLPPAMPRSAHTRTTTTTRQQGGHLSITTCSLSAAAPPPSPPSPGGTYCRWNIYVVSRSARDL